MNKIAILAVIYHEPEWLQTCSCIAECSTVPVFLTDRQGTGSLARAFNQGFLTNDLNRFEYVWFLTNITFSPLILPVLLAKIQQGDFVGITPAFNSDHVHTRPVETDDVLEAPFIEFTAPMIRSAVFRQNLLDENLPYSGHDLDWGYRIRQKGHKLGVCHATKIEHVYIRHSQSKHPSTIDRLRLRDQFEEPTKQALRRKYGPDWFKKLRHFY